MTGSTLRILIAVILLAHGVGHWMGAATALGFISTDSWNARSWLFTRLFGDSAARGIGLVLWLAALIGFIAAGFALLNWLVPHPWWRTLAVVSAVISMIGIILYWNSFAAIFNKVGAVAVNIAVLVGLLWLNWPSETDMGF
jgi:hypothetical protein